MGPAGPTLAPAGAPIGFLAPPFRKLPPLPLLMHLGPWSSQFDPTAHVDPTGLQIEGQTALHGGILHSALHILYIIRVRVPLVDLVLVHLYLVHLDVAIRRD